LQQAAAKFCLPANLATGCCQIHTSLFLIGSAEGACFLILGTRHNLWSSPQNPINLASFISAFLIFCLLGIYERHLRPNHATLNFYTAGKDGLYSKKAPLEG